MPLIFTKLGSVAQLDEVRVNSLDGLGIALFKNNFIPTSNSVLADFTEAAFPGYAPGTIIMSTPAFLNGQGRAEADADLVTFTATGASAEMIFGFFLYDAGLVVRYAERFNAPQPMTVAGAALDVGVKFTEVSEFNG